MISALAISVQDFSPIPVVGHDLSSSRYLGPTSFRSSLTLGCYFSNQLTVQLWLGLTAACDFGPILWLHFQFWLQPWPTSGGCGFSCCFVLGSGFGFSPIFGLGFGSCLAQNFRSDSILSYDFPESYKSYTGLWYCSCAFGIWVHP